MSVKSFASLSSFPPFMTGHLRVAELVCAAARRSGFANAIWGKAWAAFGRRARAGAYASVLHAAHVLARARARRGCGARLKAFRAAQWGSGDPGGLTPKALSPSTRLLAAADVYAALVEPRVHRPALRA